MALTLHQLMRLRCGDDLQEGKAEHETYPEDDVPHRLVPSHRRQPA